MSNENYHDKRARAYDGYAERLEAMTSEVRTWPRSSPGQLTAFDMLPAGMADQYTTMHSKMAAFAEKLRGRAAMERRAAEKDEAEANAELERHRAVLAAYDQQASS